MDGIEEPQFFEEKNSSGKVEQSATEDVQEASNSNLPSVDEKALLRKLDLRLVPWLTLLYLLNFLDRSSIGNAKLYNMESDIHITDTQYLVALTTFFFPYAIFEMPSNVLLRKLRPSRWLAFLMTMWGITMTLHGVISNYGGLITLRFFLGLFESGLYPGIAFYLSCWYKRTELGTRFALFFTSATIAGAFGGLLAAAIANMGGIGGRPAWAWIFILEGLFTVLVGIASFWVVQDFPDTAKFLTEEERAFVINRLQSDQQYSAAGETFKMKYIWQCLSDKKTWLGAGIYMGFDGPLFAFSLFTPTIINQLGFKATTANLLSVPVYAWACMVTCFIGVLGDKLGHRGIINMVLFSVCMFSIAAEVYTSVSVHYLQALVGYIVLTVSRKPSLSYFACFLAASGIYPTIPNSVAWVSANTEGAYKRSAVLGLIIGWGNLNGAVTSNVYRAKDKPWYSLGHGIVLAYIAIGLISSFALRVVLKRENAVRARGERDEIIGEAKDAKDSRKGKVYESVEAARIDKGDMWSGFHYTL